MTDRPFILCIEWGSQYVPSDKVPCSGDCGKDLAISTAVSLDLRATMNNPPEPICSDCLMDRMKKAKEAP